MRKSVQDGVSRNCVVTRKPKGMRFADKVQRFAYRSLCTGWTSVSSKRTPLR